MNFFERQQKARSSTRRLIFLFALAVIGIVVAVDLAVWLVLSMGNTPDESARIAASGSDSRVTVITWVSILTLSVIGISSLVRITMLRSGGAEVARSLGAVPVSEDTQDLALRRLRNVVEEIAIASSVPMPQIYVMEQEEGINAFAAGYSPNDAVVAVTRGALDRLNRAELQAVVAHEFSHILNGDMRLNIRLMGLLFGILVLGIVGREIMIHVRGGRDDKGALAILVAGAVLAVIGYVGVFFGRLIKAGVSRSREYLADASAVQFTRQTEGLAGALKKIAGLPSGSRLQAADTEEVSHMLFGDGMGLSSWFATHPPVLDRIKALDPSFDASQFNHLKAQWQLKPPRGSDEDLAMGFAPDGTRLVTPASLPTAKQELPISAAMVAEQVGSPASDDMLRAGSIATALTEPLREIARRQDRALPLVLALLLDQDVSLRERQIAEIVREMDDVTGAAAGELYGVVSRLHPMLRLPLASLAFPVLRRRPRPELARFLKTCEVLISIDGHVAISEYCLGRLLRRQTVESLDPSRFAPIGRRKLIQAKAEVANLFAVLAQHGHDSAQAAQRAFVAGLSITLPSEAMAYAPPTDFVRALEAALPVLDALEPMGKALLVEGMVAAISHDGHVSVSEAELLRTVCAVLHCPLPPMLEQ